jgi:putative FmdB family regulatory protein
MPIFEYQCSQCGHNFEYLVLPKSPAAKCPKCQSKKLDQQISLCAVSSASTKKANLSAAQRKAAKGQKERQDEKHRHLHEHFEDTHVTRQHKDD